MTDHLSESIRLVDLVADVSPPIVSDHHFLDCDLHGPAMLILLDDNTVYGCSLGAGFAGIESLLIEVPLGREVVGGIGLTGVTMQNCRFHGVGWIGARETLDMLRAGVGRP